MRRLGLVILALCLLAGFNLPADRSSAPGAEMGFRPVSLEALQSSAPVNLSAPYRVTVGAAAVQLTSSGNVHGVVIQAICPGQTIYVGIAGVTTATGFPMVDGQTLTLEVRNANQIYAIASAAAQSISVLPFARY